MGEHGPFYRHRRFVRKLINQRNWDWWSIWDGAEGVGKSTAAIWAALMTSYDENTGTNYFARNWPDLIVYTAEELLTAIDNAKKGTSIILDEAGEVWYYKEWYDEVQRALDKASQQIRYKGLDIHLCTPSIGYISRIAVRRVKDWCHVIAPNYERGFMEMLKPYHDKYGKYKTPRWDTKLFYRYHELPRQVYEPYSDFKIKAATVRLAKYIDTAHKQVDRDERPFRDAVDDLVAQVRDFHNQSDLMNSRQRYDFGMICYEFRTTIEVARAAVKLLERGRIAHGTGLPPPPEARVAGGRTIPRHVDQGSQGGEAS